MVLIIVHKYVQLLNIYIVQLLNSKVSFFTSSWNVLYYVFVIVIQLDVVNKFVRKLSEIIMKVICKAQNFGLSTTTSGVLKIINNYSDIQNFKRNSIALFNKNFLTSDSLIIISNLLEKGAVGFISFNSTKSDHGCIAAKEMGMNFYSISSKSNKILSYEGKNITLINEKIFEGIQKKVKKVKNDYLK